MSTSTRRISSNVPRGMVFLPVEEGGILFAANSSNSQKNEHPLQWAFIGAHCIALASDGPHELTHPNCFPIPWFNYLIRGRATIRGASLIIAPLLYHALDVARDGGLAAFKFSSATF